MTRIDLGRQDWQLSGWTPDTWRLLNNMELGAAMRPEIAPISCRVPGSVQQALLEAGLLPDWNVGLNSRACEWVENRHWMFETEFAVPAEGGARLCFEGLDGVGEIWIDDKKAAEFSNAFLPLEIDLQKAADVKHRLQVVFLCPPRWLGQICRTSEIRDWKPRFNYTWDWIPRMVQIGISGAVTLETGPPSALDGMRFFSGFDPERGVGSLHFFFDGEGNAHSVQAVLRDGDRETGRVEIPPGGAPYHWEVFSVEPWQPNGNGESKLYELELTAGDDKKVWRVGFKHITWKPCAGAPSGADPWICCINGEDTFLQGVNWTPIRPNFADLTREDYALRLRAYQAMGMNCIRVWGGGCNEPCWLYDLCDELGLLVWQDFPLSSSGIENWPPEDPRILSEALAIASYQIARLQKHSCLALWCGGNELQGGLDGEKTGAGLPATLEHPLLGAFAHLVEERDPNTRFVPTTASGPRFMANGADFGCGMHWDVHGPWAVDKVGMEPWQDYWKNDDALFRSEMGNPGAQSSDLICRYLGDCDFQDARLANPYWQRFGWWFEMDEFLEERGDLAWEIEDYVAWSQQRQEAKLAYAVKTFKARFPACGGLLIWMGHDSFPCPVNTSLLDFDGNPKPVCAALTKVLSSTLHA